MFRYTITIVATIVLMVSPQVIPAQEATGGYSDLEEATVAVYDELANTLLSIDKVEELLVKLLLMNYNLQAQLHLERAKGQLAAAKPDLVKVKEAMEGAAGRVAMIANEGGKDVDAIKQRLIKGGHHHHTSAETMEEYLIVGKEAKKAFLELASEIGKMAQNAGTLRVSDIDRITTKLTAAMTSISKAKE